MSDLIKRSITGVLFALVIIIGTISHPIVFAIIFLTFQILTQLEFYNLTRKKNHFPQKVLGLSMGVFIFLICFAIVSKWVSQATILFLIPLTLAVFVFEIFRKNTNTIQNSAVTILGTIYVAVPFSLLNFIIYPDFPAQTKFYPWVLAGIFFILWTYDSVAYFVGSKFGKHKLHKRISPKKSWEGLIGGGIFAVVVGILNAVLFPVLNLITWIIIALLTVTFGTLGDLFESKIKRNLDVKDSGSILPGHGGFLDRFDSLLFAVPVIYIWLTIVGNI